MKRPDRVYAYVRVSSDEQATKGVSLEAQRRRLEQFAATHALDVLAVLEDAGKSAGSLDRDGLSLCLRALDDGEIDGLLIAKFDRLTRRVGDWDYLLQRYFIDPIDEGGKRLWSSGETLETRTANGRLMTYILAALAQCELETTVERTRVAMRHKREKGEALGHAPYGKKPDPATGQLVPDPAEAAVLGVILQAREEGSGLRAIAETLNRAGIPSRSGRPWSHSTIVGILKRHAPP